jgi:dihydroorotate dehydrogenase electron transfer subunit
MLKKVSDFCNDKGMECYVSLEENMACGIGSCLGCVVKTVKGYQRVCKEGPIFNAKEILWE